MVWARLKRFRETVSADCLCWKKKTGATIAPVANFSLTEGSNCLFDGGHDFAGSDSRCHGIDIAV